MRILFIAPEPFFENRGTPIAVRNILQVIGELGHRTDLVTYRAGQDVSIPGTNIHRCVKLPFKDVPIGFSFRKVLLDLLTYPVVVTRLMARHYDVIHCVEEGIFIGLLSFPRRDAVICYDMDSSLSEQLTMRGRLCRALGAFFQSLERWAVSKSTCVVTVCPSLTQYARSFSSGQAVFQIEDTPVIRHEAFADEREAELREKLSLHGRKAVVYIGNLAPYQGVDLLLEAFSLVVREQPKSVLIIVGGNEAEVLAKRRIVRALGIKREVIFVGFVPPEKAGVYLSLADILVSPRTRGTNFPMKVYSYLASGKPLVATDLAVHNQTLSGETALLAKPTPEDLARGILKVLLDPELGKSLAEAGKRLVEREFSEEAYRKKVAELYEWIAVEVERRRGKVR